MGAGYKRLGESVTLTLLAGVLLVALGVACGVWSVRLGPSADRWALRSKTYQGIADAMAAQWGGCD